MARTAPAPAAEQKRVPHPCWRLLFRGRFRRINPNDCWVNIKCISQTKVWNKYAVSGVYQYVNEPRVVAGIAQ